MRKKITKIILLGAVIIMGLGIFVGCGSSDYHNDRVNVTIRAEYRDRFLAEDFSVEDFSWDNVENIEYEGWMDSIERGFMTVYLGNRGHRRVRAAVEHFRELPFVLYANRVPKVFASI